MRWSSGKARTPGTGPTARKPSSTTPRCGTASTRCHSSSWRAASTAPGRPPTGAGREEGWGSSRDGGAKGPALLGVRAVIAEGYERIHRSNLVGMGVLPLQFLPGENAASHGLTGRESFSIRALAAGLEPRSQVTIEVVSDTGATRTFRALC